MGRRVDLTLAVLNGVVGDYLHRTGNGLATPMEVVRGEAGARVAVLVPGLMCTEDVWRQPDGTDYGSLLARDLGYSPLYVRYNSGRSVADNGRELARVLETLTSTGGIEEILLVGFSMGGLVIRSACHLAEADGIAGADEVRWLRHVRRVFYVATPHLGSPWERAGRTLTGWLHAVPDPYARLAAELGDLRSAGIKDLGDPTHPYPLLRGMRHHLIAGYVDARMASLFGDVMVPLASGTNGACVDARALPPEHVRILRGISHMDLARSPEVYAHIRAWCEEAA